MKKKRSPARPYICRRTNWHRIPYRWQVEGTETPDWNPKRPRDTVCPLCGSPGVLDDEVGRKPL